MQILSILAAAAALTPLAAAGPSGLHAFIHADVHTFQGEDCAPLPPTDPNAGHGLGYKRYNIKPDMCHNTKKIDIASYWTQAVAHADEAEKKGCQVAFYSDNKCKQYLQASAPISKDKGECAGMEGKAGSIKLVCGENLEASEEMGEDRRDDEHEDEEEEEHHHEDEHHHDHEE